MLRPIFYRRLRNELGINCYRLQNKLGNKGCVIVKNIYISEYILIFQSIVHLLQCLVARFCAVCTELQRQTFCVFIQAATPTMQRLCFRAKLAGTGPRTDGGRSIRAVGNSENLRVPVLGRMKFIYSDFLIKQLSLCAIETFVKHLVFQRL